MIEILPVSDSELLAVKITGDLSSEDYDKLDTECELRASENETFDILVELEGVEGMGLDAVRKDLEFSKEYADDVGKMAVVTDETLWSRLSDFVGKPVGELMGIDLERFESHDVAMAWLRSD